MITLPDRQPVTLRAFWLVAALAMAAAMAMIATPFLQEVHPGVLWVVFSALLAAIGMIYPYTVVPFYRVFNRVSRITAQRAQTIVLAIWYLLVLSPMAKAVGRDPLCLNKPSKPTWKDRAGTEPIVQLMTRGPRGSRWRGLFPTPDPEVSTPWWTQTLLMPLFVVLLLLDVEQESDLPSEIYTLF